MRFGRIAHGAGAFLLHADMALFQRRSAGESEPLTWCIYGGRQEPWETPAETAVREISEEAGIDLAGVPLLHLDTDVQGTSFAFHTFLARLPARIVPVHSRETVDALWVRLGDDPETLWANLPYPLHTGLARAVRVPHVTRAVLSASLAARAGPSPDAG